MNKVLEILNHPGILITFNGSPITKVTYDAETETFLFWGHNTPIKVSARFLMLASWDEDENDEPPFYEQPFYIVIDEANIHHIVKFYRNDSLNIMRDIEDAPP